MKRLLVVLATFLLLPIAAVAQPAETVEYYGQDVIGSVRIVFSPTGSVLARQDYAPFGRPLFTVPAMPKETFGAQEQDGETNQGYFHARLFQTRTGRFTRPDPIEGDLVNPQRWNRYAYALNAPASVIDPNGLAAVITGTSNPACETFDCGMDLWLWSEWLFGSWLSGSSGGSISADGGGGGGGAIPTTTTTGGGTQQPAPAPTPVPRPQPNPTPTPPPTPPTCNAAIAGDCSPSKAVAWLKGAWDGVTGSCMASYIYGAGSTIVPISPSNATLVPLAGQYVQQARMNQALAYAASRPNVLGGQGLIMPFKSGAFRGLFSGAEAVGAKYVPLITAGLAAYNGVMQVIDDASAAKCNSW